MALRCDMNVFVVQIIICLPYYFYAILIPEDYRDRERESVEQVDERMGDRGIIRLLVPQTLTLFFSYTHTHAHACMTDLCVEAFACLYERQTPCKMGFSPCKTCSFREREDEAERDRERTEDTLLLLSAAISVFLPYMHTLARRLITLPTVYVQQQDSSRHRPDPAKGHTHINTHKHRPIIH